MANNNNGLQFNPINGLGGWNQQDSTSVPTIANDYYQPQLPTPLNLSMMKPKKDSQLMQDWQDVQAWQSLSSGEKEQMSDPFHELNKWKAGLRGLNREEIDLWERQNEAKTEGHDELWKERLWRNQQFVNTFGMEVFQAMPNKDDRDEMYKDYLLGNAVGRKYKDNSNLQQLMSLTPQGKEELLKSDYKSDLQLKRENQEDADKDWWDYSLGERWNAITSNAVAKGSEGMAIGTLAGSIAGGGVGSIPGLAIGGLTGMAYGALRGVVMPESAQSENQLQRKTDNEDILNKITVADNDRKKEQSLPEINNLWGRYTQAYNKGMITSEQVDEMFDNIALNGKRTSTDELGNTQQYDYQGSNYYTMFKDSDEFEHFGTLDKLKYIAQTEVLNQKYGQGSAMAVLEQDMQNYVSDHQNGWDWAGNSLKNVWVGGVANLANNVTALGALNARLWYGEEGLANYLKGKDASGDGSDNLFSPMYWNKVDQYNTFDADAIAKADANGGVSEYNNVVQAGTENDFWSWNTMNEAVRMNKFAWSDLLKNLTLGKLVRGATRVAGGVELAPGVLAQESTAAAKFINQAGAIGVMNASSLGIDAAYGMQTYEEVLRQNNERLDKLIQQDVDAEVQRRIQTPEAMAEFRQFVDAENQRRKTRAGERGSYIGVDEAEAWKAYIEHTERKVREEQEALHAEDRQQAENDAANAYAVDASVEHLRMATTNGVFKSYLFDKGTLNALRRNNPYVQTAVNKQGMYALGKHATRNKALNVLGMNVWGGFHSNYFDDVTVGFAEGFGIQDYNNYLLQKYNPAAYGSVIDDYVSPFVAGMTGVTNAMQAKRSFIDGGIGALGSFMTVSPNVSGMINHRQRMKEAAEASKKTGSKEMLSWQEMASDFVNNPILQAVADAKAATRMTEAEIKRVNDILKESGYSFDNIVETASALNGKAIAREGTSLMEAEDAKDREAFALASSLLSMKNSGVVANAQAEPNKANWSKKKRAAATIGKGLNMMLGIPMFTEAESSYTNAMQSLQDAAALGEEADGATMERQQQLVQTFLGLDANKNAIQGMSEEEKVTFAQERLKKNASSLLNMMDRTEKLQKKFEKSLQAHLHPDLQQQLMYQYVLDGRWKDRLAYLEYQITGEDNYGELPDTPASNLIAKYGSMQGYERTLKAQQKKVDNAQEAYDRAKTEANKENDPSKSIVENARVKAVRLFKERTAKAELKKQQNELTKIKQQENAVKQMLENQPEVVKAEQILRLNADDRLRMLDDFYRNDYSIEQQAEIDKAKNLLVQDGTSIHEAMERVRDAAILNHRIEDNMEVAKRIMQNPIEANQMQQALIDNRRRAVIDYFNDKVVAEALLDFQNDPESTVSQENVEQKAQGYSTAVLNGMLRALEKETIRKRGSEAMDDKTLSVMQDGIKTVLDQRNQKLKETDDLDRFVRKTKKVNHTETRPVEVQLNDQGDIGWMNQQITEERELTPNDRKLLDYAMDYAAERGIPIEDMGEQVDTEEFEKYVQERNHAYQLTANPLTGEAVETNVATVENQANMVSPEYMRGLLNDVMDAFKANKEQVTKATTDKPVAAKPESVVTKPVETKGAVVKQQSNNQREEEVRPDEVDPNDPFGLKKKKSQAEVKLQPAVPSTGQATNKPSEKSEVVVARNTQILEEGGVLNPSILEDVRVLLEELDKMKMPEQTREKLKDIIESNLNSRSFSNIQALQSALMSDAMVTNQAEAPQIDIKATALAELNIEDIKARAQAKLVPTEITSESNSNNNLLTPLPQTPAILETRDLDALMNYPVWADYIKSHNVVGFLQKLADLWNKEFANWQNTGKQGYLHQSQVVFLYDPALAENVKGSIEENGGYYNPEISSPVIMALEINDKNKSLVDNDAQLITIKDKADGKTKQYQAIGFMPASEVSTADSQTMKTTADRMGALRNRINFDDKDTHVLRYAPQNNTGKYNGTVIRTNIEKISSHTEEDRIPHATEDTPKTNVQQLMEDNVNSATESFVNATEEEKQSYEEAKNNPQILRKTSLYKKLRKAFIDRLFKKERQSADSEESNNKEIDFRLQKGTQDSYPKIVLVKKIGKSKDKNSGRPIVDLLKEVDDAGTNAQEVIESNSRFKRLFNAMKKLGLPKGLFNVQGQIANKTMFDKAVREFENSFEKALENNLHVDELHVRTEITDGQNGKQVNIHVFSGDMNIAENELTTLSTLYEGQVSPAEFTSFLKDLILDKDGNTRNGLNDSRFERVKWQVNYEDANTANDVTKSAVEKKTATDNLNDLYDDGVLEMQVTKLSYPSRSVTVGINHLMKSRLYPERTAVEPETKALEVTETHAAFETQTATGSLVDGDTGAHTEAPTRETIISGIPRLIVDTINRMINDSKTRQLTDDGRHYNIMGQLWSRVTSIKYALDKMGNRFNPTSPWATPSSLIGNSVDEFGRDVFNGVFDKMTDAERQAAFEGYDNSTAKNYAEVFMALKAFEARLASVGQAVIATGNKENPGSITAKGELNVTIRGEHGIETKKVRVAGTLDVLAIDSQGNLHIYDFKTKHNSMLTKEEAQSESKGYDRQLSMYAKFLEDEYGLKVKSINIIPIQAEYPAPRTQDDYKEDRSGSNQLLHKNVKNEFEEFKGANYQVGKEFSLDRLTDEQLVASFDKMTDAEKEAIVEAIQDQSETPAAEITKTDEIITSKPKIEQPTADEEEEEGGRSRRGRLGRRQQQNSEDTDGLLNRLKDLKDACGGQK